MYIPVGCALRRTKWLRPVRKLWRPVIREARVGVHLHTHRTAHHHVPHHRTSCPAPAPIMSRTSTHRAPHQHPFEHPFSYVTIGLWKNTRGRRYCVMQTGVHEGHSEYCEPKEMHIGFT